MTAAVQRAQTAGDAVAAAGDAAALLAQAESRISEERRARPPPRRRGTRNSAAPSPPRRRGTRSAAGPTRPRQNGPRRPGARARAEKALATAVDREKAAEAKTTEVLRRAKTAETAAGMAEAAVQAAVRKAEKAEAELARQRSAAPRSCRPSARTARAKAARAEARLAKGGSGAADHFRAALSGSLSPDCLWTTIQMMEAPSTWRRCWTPAPSRPVVAAIDTEGRGRIAPARACGHPRAVVDLPVRGTVRLHVKGMGPDRGGRPRRPAPRAAEPRERRGVGLQRRRDVCGLDARGNKCPWTPTPTPRRRRPWNCVLYDATTLSTTARPLLFLSTLSRGRRKFTVSLS